MNNTIIVTLKASGFEKDFELPNNVRLRELYPRLTSALQSTSSECFGDYETVLLELGESALLTEDATLSDYGVCTGSVLKVVGKREVNRKVRKGW